MLAFHEWSFVIALGLGIVLVLGAALGVGDLDTDVSDADTDADGESDHDAEGWTLLSMLGVGRVPMTIVAMLVCFGYGGSGLALAPLVAKLVPAHLVSVAAMGIAFVVMLIVTRPLAMLVARLVPATETYAGTHHALLGRTAELVIARDPSFAVARVRDAGGAVLRVTCRLDEDSCRVGDAVVLVDYDEASGRFLAARL